MTDAPPADQPGNELEFVRTWLEAIELSETEEKEWRKEAEKACLAYRGGQDSETRLATFNIFHSNVETLVPALYNSTPIPDVRRRFNDTDPVAKEVSEIFERALAYQVDAYDFDATVLSAVKDMAITSRGIARVRYVPSFARDGSLAYEATQCEFVPWKSFRRGPGRVWDEVPWVAFENYLSYSEVENLLEDEKGKATILKEMKFSYTAEPKKDPERQGENLSKLAARARVWEIWDKDNRKVHFISPDYTSRRLTSIDDPLSVTGFFPIPRPMAALIAPDSLVPITLLQVYEKLLEELNEVQRRIIRLTKQLRPRGGYAGGAEDVKLISEADDGELVPMMSAAGIAQNGGLDKAITWFPLEATVKALEQLVVQRESIKATIYEVTGLSDIIRGASDPQETATAQQIKTQWGALRIQRMQTEVARFTRDLFRLKAEIMANKFSPDTLWLMTGLNYPTQEEKQRLQMQAQQAQQPLPPEAQEALGKPSQEEVLQLIKEDALRGFRVDIESDSTVRGDLQKSQEQMSLFLQGTAQYLSAVGPMVQEGAMPEDTAIEIYAAFCRSFRLGKQAEDALDKLADQAKKSAGQPKPNPALEAEQMKAKAQQEKTAADLQMAKEKHAMELEKMQLGLQIEREKLELKRQEMDMQREQMALDMQAHQQQMALDAEAQQRKAEVDAQAMEHKATLNERTAQLQAEGAERKHEMSLEVMAEKAKQAKQKPKRAGAN